MRGELEEQDQRQEKSRARVLMRGWVWSSREAVLEFGSGRISHIPFLSHVEICHIHKLVTLI